MDHRPEARRHLASAPFFAIAARFFAGSFRALASFCHETPDSIRMLQVAGKTPALASEPRVRTGESSVTDMAVRRTAEKPQTVATLRLAARGFACEEG